MKTENKMLALHWREQDGYGRGLEVFATADALYRWLDDHLADETRETARTKVVASCRAAVEGSGEWDFNGTNDSEERTLEGTHFMLRRCEVRR